MLSKLMVMFSLFGFLLSGCVSVDSSLLLDKGTKIEIVDVSTSSFVSTALANDRESVEMIKRRIMELTKEELEKRSIEAFLHPTYEAAKLKYDFRTISAGYRIIGSDFGVIGNSRFEVKYRASLETPEGKKIFSDSDEKDDSDIDEVYEKIAKRVAKIVADSCFKK